MAFKVEGLDQFVNDVKTKHDSVQAQLNTLRTQEETITNPAMWQGAARDSFKSLMDGFYEKAYRMNTQLEEIADNILKAHGQFTDLDSSAAASLKQYNDFTTSSSSSLHLPPLS